MPKKAPPPLEPFNPMPLIVGAALVIGGLFGFSYYTAQKDLSIILAKNEALQRTIAQEARELVEQTTKRDELNEAVIQGAKLKDENEALATTEAGKRKQLEAGKARWELVRSQFLQAIEDVRLAVTTAPIPSLPGPEGEPFLNVKVVSIRPDSMVIEHEAGMSRLALKDVPTALADRLRLKWLPTFELPPHPDPDDEDRAFISKFKVAGSTEEVASEEAKPSFSQEIVDRVMASGAEGLGNKSIDDQKQAMLNLRQWILQAMQNESVYEARYDALANSKDSSAREQARNTWQDLNSKIEKANHQYKILEKKLRMNLQKADKLRSPAP